MMRPFYPNVFYRSVYEIDFRKYYEKGYRAVLFDIDNTLVRHDAPHDARSCALFEELRQIGFRTCVISNNFEPRVRSFCDGVRSSYVCRAHKPAAAGYLKALEMLGVGAEEALAVGDQLFTDIWGAKRAGIYSILTQRIGPDPILKVKLKRILEAIVKPFLRSYLKRHPEPHYFKGI